MNTELPKFRAYLKQLSMAQRDELSVRARKEKLRCSAGHITNVAAGSRKASTDLVKFIVANSGGKLKPRHGIEYLYGLEA